jgi:SAM-dependent methyltransferase
MIFDKYANYYDLYYAQKDYKGEVDYIISLSKLYTNREINNVLDIGCGTGGHIIQFCKQGIHVKGIDLSPIMVKTAQEKIITKGIKGLAEIEIADIRSYRDDVKYDLIVSMFAVMGYITANKDIIVVLKTIKSQLQKNGLFIFDVWFGPTVLHDMPETRIHEYEKDGKIIIKFVQPNLNVLNETVDVDYTILTLENGRYEISKESHCMRYYFIQQIKLLIENADLKLCAILPFREISGTPKLGDWNITIVVENI